jgi:hypothetical protein
MYLKIQQMLKGQSALVRRKIPNTRAGKTGDRRNGQTKQESKSRHLIGRRLMQAKAHHCQQSRRNHCSIAAR